MSDHRNVFPPNPNAPGGQYGTNGGYPMGPSGVGSYNHPPNSFTHAGPITQGSLPEMTGQIGKMNIGPPHNATELQRHPSNDSSRFPGVGQSSSGIYPGNQPPIRMGVRPTLSSSHTTDPSTGIPQPSMNSSHFITSSYPSTGQVPLSHSLSSSQHYTTSDSQTHFSERSSGEPSVSNIMTYPKPSTSNITVGPPLNRDTFRPTGIIGPSTDRPISSNTTGLSIPPTHNLTGSPPSMTRHLPSSRSMTGPPSGNMSGPHPGGMTGPPPGGMTGPPPVGMTGHPPGGMTHPPGGMTGPSPGGMTGPPPGGMTGPPPRGMTGPPPGGMTGPPPRGMTGPPPGGMTGPPPGSMTGPSPGMTGPPRSGMTGPPPSGMTGPPPSGMTGPPPRGMTGPPPSGMTGPLPSGMTGPPPGGMTGPPPSGMTGPPPSGMTGPPPSDMTGPPPRGMTGPPPSGMTGPPPRGMTGPHPSGMTGPPPNSMTRSHPGGTGMTGPSPSGMTGPPPSGMTAPVSQRYSHEGTTTNTSNIQYPSQPSPYAAPGGGAGLVMQNQLQLPELQPVNLLENRNILPTQPIQHPLPSLPGHLSDFGPDPGVFCSSMNNVPATSGLLNKLKLPLAIHIHPFKDSKAKSCPVINPSVIVRCRVCRGYINPYVSFSDARHWRCNLCFRTNVVPEDYDYNPHSGKRGDRTHHTELRHSSVEYIAPSEYMVRPPQPSVYLFLIDVSYPTIESGLLGVFCRVLLECLTRLPGDGRTMVGFMTYDQHLHFYNLKSSQTQPQMLVVSDLNDVFIPTPHSLLVNLRESKELVKNLLEELPKMFSEQRSMDSALGPALQVAEKLLHPIGGRITVLQSSIPNMGPGTLKIKEQSQSALKKDQLNMGASNDFYKKLALECSAQQISVDLFVFSNSRRFIDLTTISTIAKFSSGQISYYSDFHHTKEYITRAVEKDFRRYLTRNIGFEAVMRIRCTEGISLHTFHGNFFVRSTDLLSLPNVNPDHGFCMNLAIDESLKEYSTVCIQAALLYTTCRGERRIRVHTLCLPVSDQFSQLYAGINVRATAAVLGKMAVGRMTTASLGDAREALLNTVQDSTKAYRSNLCSSMKSSQFNLPASLKLLPLYVLSLLKHPSLTLNPNIMVDERAQAMNLMLTLPLNDLLPNIYPNLYSLHTLCEKEVIDVDGEEILSPPLLQLSAEKLSRHGVYLMDYGKGLYVWVNKDTPPDTVKQLFGVLHFGAIAEFSAEVPVQDNSLSKFVCHLIKQIRLSRQHYLPLLAIREDGSQRKLFVNKLVEDKTEDGTSYYELLSHIARQINK